MSDTFHCYEYHRNSRASKNSVQTSTCNWFLKSFNWLPCLLPHHDSLLTRFNKADAASKAGDFLTRYTVPGKDDFLLQEMTSFFHLEERKKIQDWNRRENVNEWRKKKARCKVGTTVSQQGKIDPFGVISGSFFCAALEHTSVTSQIHWSARASIVTFTWSCDRTAVHCTVHSHSWAAIYGLKMRFLKKSSGRYSGRSHQRVTQHGNPRVRIQRMRQSRAGARGSLRSSGSAGSRFGSGRVKANSAAVVDLFESEEDILNLWEKVEPSKVRIVILNNAITNFLSYPLKLSKIK